MHGDKSRVQVTGGASFIGAALLDALLGRKPQLKFRAKKPEEAAAILDPILAERMPSAVSLSKEVATPN